MDSKKEQIEEQKINTPTDGKQEMNNEKTPFYKNKVVWIPFLIFIIAGIAAWYWYKGTLGYISTDDAFIDGDKLSLGSKVLGRVTKLFVDEGDNVKEGEVVAKLDSLDLIAQRNQASASLTVAEGSLKLASINVDKAQDDFQRAKIQFENKIIPKEQYDHAEKGLQAAQAEFEIAKTRIESARAQLNVIITQLRNTTIISPMDGVVAKKWILEGDVVQPGEPIFTIYNLKNLWVTGEFEETDLASLRIGDSTQISVDAYPDQNFAGTVYQIGANTASQFSLIPPNNAAGNFTKVTQRVPVKISIIPVNAGKDSAGQKAYRLLPGMSVELKVKIK